MSCQRRLWRHDLIRDALHELGVSLRAIEGLGAEISLDRVEHGADDVGEALARQVLLGGVGFMGKHKVEVGVLANFCVIALVEDRFSLGVQRGFDVGVKEIESAETSVGDDLFVADEEFRRFDSFGRENSEATVRFSNFQNTSVEFVIGPFFEGIDFLLESFVGDFGLMDIGIFFDEMLRDGIVKIWR